MDEDVEQMTKEQLIHEVKKLRAGIRQHRDSSGQDLCWHHPALWSLLPEKTHIPPDLVVDRWAADGESGSHHDFRFRYDVWTMLFHQINVRITPIISTVWYFTTKSDGIWEFQTYTNRFGKLTFSAYLAAEQGRLLELENYRSTLDHKDIGALPQKIKSIRQQAWDNLKFYNYSLTDIEKAASETVPWQ